MGNTFCSISLLEERVKKVGLILVSLILSRDKNFDRLKFLELLSHFFSPIELKASCEFFNNFGNFRQFSLSLKNFFYKRALSVS